jgi:chaperonin GroEL
MASKQLLFRAEAREKILRGATALAEAVRITLGPRSKCVLIEKKWGKPLVCNDGVTIAKEIDLKDREENLGARMIRDAAERTGDAVGDGTSTATILAHAVFADALRNATAGASAIDIKRGLDMGVKVAVDALRGLSRPVESRRERAQVATISAHNNETIGNLVADAFEKVGRDGAISVEEAQGIETTLEVVEGMQFDHGYLSPYFVSDPERMQAILDDARVLVFERRIATVNDLLPLLEQMAKAHAPLLIIAEDVEGDALATLVVNSVRRVLPCAAVKAPGYGDRRKSMLEDIAVLTGARFFAEELGTKLESVKLDDLGRARRVIIERDKTTIVGGAGDKKAISARCAELRHQIERTTSQYEREQLEARLSKLTGGVAVVRVGAPSEVELKSLKEAFDDAISATRAALDEGIVPGAGLALLRVADRVKQEADKQSGDCRTGLLILARALESPARQIAENSGADAGVVVARMREGSGTLGFDAARGEFVDLLRAGIVDPTKVTRIALENAVSVAGVLLLAEATLTELPKAEHERPGPEEP